MPAINQVNLEDLEQLERAAQEEVSERSASVQAAWDYYDRRMKRPLKVRSGQPDDNIMLGMAAKMVNQAVGLLFGQEPQLTIEGQATDALTGLWSANKKMLFLQNMGIAGALTGHNFIKLMPNEPAPRLVRLQTEQVSVFWLADDIERVLAYKIQWRDQDTDRRQDIIDQDNMWLIRDMTRGSQSRSWTVVNEEMWPWPWCPIVDWKNLPAPRQYYGLSDLVNPGLNDGVNFSASNINRIIRFHAHPKTIGTGMSANQLQETAVDAFWTIPSESARVFNLEMQSDLAGAMGFMNFLRGAFFSEHNAVDIDSLKDKLGQLTNFALRVLFYDALLKLGLKRGLYEAGLIALSQRGLDMLGWGNDQTVTVDWGDPLPFNTLEEINEIEKEIGLGLLSKQTATEIRGRDWKTEQKRKEEESAADDNIGSRLLRAFENGQDVDTGRRSGSADRVRGGLEEQTDAAVGA